ncbi:MAG: hypothetical protein AVDCRST_MAG44-1223, partial [uncultured Sphingomonas sp.]
AACPLGDCPGPAPLWPLPAANQSRRRDARVGVGRCEAVRDDVRRGLRVRLNAACL